MARWVLLCQSCGKPFTYDKVSPSSRGWLHDAFAWLFKKPEFPENGLKIECPKCKQTFLYHRRQLTYRID